MAEYHELVYKDYIVPQEYKTNDPRGPGWYLDKEIKSKFSKRTSFSYQSDANANIAVGHQGTLIYIAEGQGGNRFYGPQTRGVIRFIHAENTNDIWLRLDVRLGNTGTNCSFIPPGGSVNLQCHECTRFTLSPAQDSGEVTPNDLIWKAVFVKDDISIAGPGGGEN